MEDNIKSKRRLKPHTILFIITAVVAVFTWIIPGGVYNDDGVFSTTGYDNAAGFYDIFAAPIQGFFDAIDIILFIFVIGAFITMIMKTGTLQAAVQSIVKKLEGRERTLIIVLTLIFGLGGTTFGMCEETVAFYALIAAVFVAAKLDVVVVMLVVFAGSAIGVLASTINPFAIGVAVDAVGVEGVSLSSGLLSRSILFVILETVLIIFILRYVAKVKENPENSIVYDLKEQHESKFATSGEDFQFTSKRKIILGLFIFTFVVLVISVIPWTKFDFIPFNDVFINMHDSLANSFFGKFLGLDATTSDNYWATDSSNAALGDWWFGQLTTWFFFMTLIIAFIHSYKNQDFGENEIVDTIFEGFRDFSSVAFICGISRGIKIILTQSGMDATILHNASEMLSGLPAPVFGILLYWVYIPLGLLIPSTSGLAGASLPIMGPLAENVIGANGSTVAILAFTMGVGISNIVSPTGMAIVSCSILDLPYGRYVKLLLPLLGIIFAICTIYVGFMALIV